MPGRSKVACPICGRFIYADHNLSNKNFDAHVEACPRQQAEKAARASRSYQREMTRKVKKAGVGEVPMPGQLGLPGVDGIPEVVP